MAAALLAVGIASAFALSRNFGAVTAAYAALQTAYTLLLKRVPLLDVVILAAGFVLRAIAGAVAIRVEISPWLVLCTFFIALFLALCKRRQEKTLRLEDEQRPSVRGYGVALLNLLISISATSAIVAYALYTVSAETVAKFGTARLGFTIPFVVFGVFRYLLLVFTKDEGERPERTLLTDAGIILTVALYLVAFAAILALR
jgi:4-hydroxybenzoate polyprenyltransferase